MVRSKPFDILLVYGELSLGGIETLIVRVANTFASTDVRCTVLCTGGELLANLDPGVFVIIYSDGQDAREKLKQRSVDVNDAETIVVTFDPTTCALGYWLHGVNAFGRCRHLTGVFHTRAYFLEGEDRLRHGINRMILDSTAESSVFFMNEECRQTHAQWSARLFKSSPIIPLGIESKSAKWHPSTDNRLKIVSVGRLVGFKAYNLGSIPISQQLRARGIDLQWHIFGSGELEPEMRSRLSHAGDDVPVVLCGDLPYSDFESTVIQHDVFIGVGTAALEAAMLGVPALMALDSEETSTHGYLQDLPFGNLGERQAKPPRESLVELLECYHRAPAEQKIAIGEAGRSVALHYGIEHYCTRMLEAGLAAGTPSRARAWLVGTLYREATSGRTRQIANSLWRQFNRKQSQ